MVLFDRRSVKRRKREIKKELTKKFSTISVRLERDLIDKYQDFRIAMGHKPHDVFTVMLRFYLAKGRKSFGPLIDKMRKRKLRDQ